MYNRHFEVPDKSNIWIHLESIFIDYLFPDHEVYLPNSFCISIDFWLKIGHFR